MRFILESRHRERRRPCPLSAQADSCTSTNLIFAYAQLSGLPFYRRPACGCDPVAAGSIAKACTFRLSVLCLRDARDATRSRLPAYEERTGSGPTVHGGVRPGGQKRPCQKATDDANQTHNGGSESSGTSRAAVTSIEGACDLTPESMVWVVCHELKAFTRALSLVKG